MLTRGLKSDITEKLEKGKETILVEVALYSEEDETAYVRKENPSS